MTKKEINHIEQLIREANSSDDVELYNSAYKYLESIKSIEEDYLLYYYKGLICYSNSDIEDFRVNWAIKNFKKSLELSPDSLMTKVYLAHSYYDLGKYIKTSEVLTDVFSNQNNIEVFTKNNQIWRIVNLIELFSISYLKLGWIDKFLPVYFAWIKMYDNHIKEKDFYFPESLIIETAQFLKDKGEFINEKKYSYFTLISLNLINMIKSSEGFEEIYSEELKILEDWNRQEQHNPLHIPINLDS